MEVVECDGNVSFGRRNIWLSLRSKGIIWTETLRHNFMLARWQPISSKYKPHKHCFRGSTIRRFIIAFGKRVCMWSIKRPRYENTATYIQCSIYLNYDEIKLLGFGHRHQFSFHNHHQLALDYMKEEIAEDIGNARQFCIC